MIVLILLGLAIFLPISAFVLMVKVDIISCECIGHFLCQIRALCVLLPIVWKYLVCRKQNNNDCSEV